MNLAELPRGPHEEVHEASGYEDPKVEWIVVRHPGYDVLLCKICGQPYQHGNDAPNLTHTCGDPKCRQVVVNP